MQDMVDQTIDSYSDNKSLEIVDQFTKKINKIDYQVLVVKYKYSYSSYDPFIYDVVYIRLLDRGSLTRSFLIATSVFTDTDTEADKKIILKNIYDLEDTLGGFDESKQ